MTAFVFAFHGKEEQEGNHHEDSASAEPENEGFFVGELHAFGEKLQKAGGRNIPNQSREGEKNNVNLQPILGEGIRLMG